MSKPQAIEFSNNLTEMVFISMVKYSEDKKNTWCTHFTTLLRPFTLMPDCHDAPLLLGEISEEVLLKCRLLGL
jgi:hypothetical protein